MLEYLQWNGDTSLTDLLYIKVEVPAGIAIEQAHVPDNSIWEDNDYSRTREIGDGWYDRGESVALRLPSVVSPFESNLLFNQEHADFSRIVIGEPDSINLKLLLKASQ